MLRLMGRPAEAGSYDRLLDELARRAPEAALGADFMVGFPEETKGDFEEMRGLLERSPLTYAHVFPFSPRPGTPAEARPRVPAAVVTERAGVLRRAAAAKDYRFRRRFLGRALEGVVISNSDRGGEVLTGNAIRVLVPLCRAPRRERVRVSVRRVLPGRTEGEIVT